MVNKDSVIGVELYITDNKKLFDKLYQRKNEIENDLAFEKGDKENLSVQNMPLLKYGIDTERKCEGDLSDLIITSVKDGKHLN